MTISVLLDCEALEDCWALQDLRRYSVAVQGYYGVWGCGVYYGQGMYIMSFSFEKSWTQS